MEERNDILKQNEAAADEFERSQVILTPGQLVIKRFSRNKLSVFGLCIIAFMLVFSIIGPFLSPYDQGTLFYTVTTTDEAGNEVTTTVRSDELTAEMAKVALLDTKAPPSAEHWLGTDNMGRDIFTRLMYGGRVSLMVGVCVVIFELLIGVTMGGIAGYYGGAVDMIIMRLVEIFYAIPFIPLMLIIASILLQFKISPNMKIYYIMIIMGVIYWAGVARMIRGQILSLREMEYMQATEAMGLKTSRKIFRHLIPNVMPLIIVMATMDLGGIILTESTMSYLGVGTPETMASWGKMVGAITGNDSLVKYWFLWVPASVCILLTVLAFNFVGDGLRDAFDPKMKR